MRAKLNHNEPTEHTGDEASTEAQHPLLAAMHTAHGQSSDTSADSYIVRFGFSVLTDDALSVIVDCSPNGVIDVGAGTGALSRLLLDRGLHVVPIDPDPAPSQANPWFAGTDPWCEIHRADHTTVASDPALTLLLSWPTKDRVWPAEALSLFHEAGGSCVIYIGEPAGGRTGDDVFHRLLGELPRCRQCDLGNENVPCVCDFAPIWTRTGSVAIPQLPGHHDELVVYERLQVRRRLFTAGSRAGWISERVRLWPPTRPA